MEYSFTFNTTDNSTEYFDPSQYMLPFDFLHIRIIFTIGYAMVFCLCLFGK